MSEENTNGVQALRWVGHALILLDQRLLPQQERYLECQDAAAVADAIRQMVVRGAPAIGIAAAYAVVLSARQHGANLAALRFDMQSLQAARPTAVNLGWAVEQMARVVEGYANDAELPSRLLARAIELHDADLHANYRMAELGAAILAREPVRPFSVLTHCNAGSLATTGHGTALGVIRTAWQQGVISHVHADETRPWLQGSRLTAWELQRDGIPVTLNADVSAAWLLAQGKVRWIIVGADRITANGDVANKIGTYGLAILARHHRVKLMVVAPTSTVDMSLNSGRQIEIEHRPGHEVCELAGQRMAPFGVPALNPVFDVTPANLVDVIVTEKGVVHAPTRAKMWELMQPHKA